MLEKRILWQDSNSITALITDLFLTLTARKNSFPQFRKHNCVIFWVGGKSCIVKNEKSVVFLESQYVNLNPSVTHLPGGWHATSHV